MKSMMVLFRRVRGINKWYFVPFLLVELLGLVVRCVQVMFPERVLTGLTDGNTFRLIINLAAYFMLVGVANSLVELLNHRKYVNNQTISRVMSSDLFEYSCSMRYDEYEDFDSRKNIELAFEGMHKGSIDQSIETFISAIANIVFVASISYVFRFINWRISIVLVVSIAINIVCEYFRAKYDYDCYEKYKDVNMRMLYSRDKLTWKQFGKEVRIFRLYDYVMSIARKYVEELSAIQKIKSRKTLFVYLMLGLYDIVQRIILTAYVVFLCINGKVEIERFSSLIVALLACFSAINAIAKSIVKEIEASKYIKSYSEIIQNNRKNDELAINAGEKTEQFEKLAVNGLSFSYPRAETKVLRDITVEFHKGKKYGIVGKNGSGKSTFIKVLLGLYNSYEGEIRLDSREKNTISFDSWNALFSSVLQDFVVYGYSLRDNITMMTTANISRQVQDEIDSLGMEMDDCLSPEYGDGHEISGGQGQKVALLRAINRDAPIVVMDEPTASLSPNNEISFYEDVKTKFSGKTMLLVSHRLASCKLCDEILVFDDGKIVEKGSHKELMEMKGLYYSMFLAQKELYSSEEQAV